MKEQSALAANLRKFRKHLRLTQSDVAGALGIERSRYAHYENNTTPSAENLQKLAALFNVSLDQLMGAPPKTLILHETNMQSIIDDFLFNELRRDEKDLIIKYRLLSSEAKEALIKQIEAKINKSEK